MDLTDKFAQAWSKECETSYIRLVQLLPLWLAIHISDNEELSLQVDEIMATFSPKKKSAPTFYKEYDVLSDAIRMEVQRLKNGDTNDIDYDDYISDEEYELDELSYYEQGI